MSEDIKNGDMVMCWYDGKLGVDGKGPFRFVGIASTGAFVVEAAESMLRVRMCDYIEKVQEPTYKPFTRETFPKGLVWFKSKKSKSVWLLSGILKSGIVINTYEMSYKELLENYTMSFDQETWIKAGIEE